MRSSFAAIALILLVAAPQAIGDWELRRDDFDKERPTITNDEVRLSVGQTPLHFPRYLNELGIKRIIIRFRDEGGGRRKLSFVWNGGTMGPDRFMAKLNGVEIGVSQAVDTARRPEAWYRDEFVFELAPGSEHTLELSSPEGYASAIEFAGIRLAGPDSEPYQPACYESVGSLDRYEKELGGKGTLAKAAHVWVFAPAAYQKTARDLAGFLEKAYGEMKAIYGMDTFFVFSVEHYPAGHKRGWGGISGAGTIGYTTESLDSFAKLGTTDVRGFAGYTEEMSHGFKAYYKCDGTYEALGVAVQEEIVRRLVPRQVADAFWLPEHAKWNDTHRAYLAAARANPDPEKYPWGVSFTRILNALFLKLREDCGPKMWPDFFRTIREMDYPLHRAAKTERMKTYADIFSKLTGRDIRKEFTEFGIDLNADPPWGWQTYSEPAPR